MKVRLYTDGASSGNPGPSGIGYVICTPEGEELEANGDAIGTATNNVAEYTALLRGLQRCADLGADHVEVVSDSELMVRQLSGRYKVKNPDLKALYEEAIKLARSIGQVSYRHVLRGENSRADGLASGAVRGPKRR